MDTISQLAERQMYLKDRITAVAMGCGDANDIQALALEAATVKQQLEDARAEEEERQYERSRRDGEERRAKLEAALVTASEQKEEFAALYRKASLALGAYCTAMDEATRMANSLAGRLGVSALDSNRIAELKKDIDPLPRILDGGLQGTMKYGWDLRLQIIPLHKLGEQ